MSYTYLEIETLHKLKVWMTIVEWVDCMGVASGCGEQEACVASGSGWNLWVFIHYSYLYV